MRKIYASFFGLMVIFLITSATINLSKPKPLTEKIIFVELNFDEDSALFQPHSKAWKQGWWLSSAINRYGTNIMDYDKYSHSFENRTENIWTLLHPLIIDGLIQSYYPYNPESADLSVGVQGELLYPVLEENENFLTSPDVQDRLLGLLGYYGPQSDVPLVDEWGEVIVTVLSDGTEAFMFDAPEYIWYEDKDIVKFRLKVSVMVDQKGVEKSRTIKSICPIVNRTSDMGNKIGEKELLWLNFEEVENYLNKAYYFDKNWKPTTFLNHVLQKVKHASFPARG